MDLSTYCQELADASVDAGDWVNRNPELVRNEKESLLKDLRKARRAFRNCGRAAARKMCAGVFGPSQAGKSYLISALARGRDTNDLLAKFAGQEVDFISEINPEGGKESTGLVTRFTLSEPPNLPAGYPVQLRLLSEMDLVKILANTYYADCEPKDEAKSDIPATLEKLKKRAGNPSGHIDLDDMEDLREYLLRDFRSKARVQELERQYWDTALELGPRLDLEGRIQLYALIWDEVEEFTNLLRTLLQALESLKYPEELFCTMDALIPRDKSIIDVATLNGLDKKDEYGTLQVQTPAGIKQTLPRAVITALTAELTIVIKDKPADYFEHTDLLDFPGYRSRYKFDDVRKELKKDGILKELFLRGKVAYLFQRYSAERELNSMLLCIGPSNQEVQDLPGVINDWIASTHGETPEDRINKAVALFFILTKFDMEFEEKKGAPSLETRWDNRLHASLLDFFGKQHDWPTQWTPNQAFNNLFLLRNPNYKFKSVLNYDGDIETGVKPESQELVRQMQASFNNSPTVAAHFHNPDEAWREAMRLNDGGISHIRESLNPLCNPELKKQQLLQNIETIRQGLEHRLKRFYKSDDKAELRKQKTILFANLARRITLLENQKRRLSELLKAFSMPDDYIYDLHAEASRRYQEMRENEKIAADNAESKPQEISDVDNLDLSSLISFGESPEDEAEEETQAATMDEASFFASFIESKWVENLHKLADDPVVQKYFQLNGQELSSLVSELATGAARLGFKENLSEAFRKVASFADSQKSSIISKQAAIASRTFNNYIDWLSFNPNTKTDAERTVKLPNSPERVIFSRHEESSDMPVLAPRGKHGEIFYINTWAANWLHALGSLILSNVDFDGKQSLNVEENTALGAILKKFARQQLAATA